MARRTSTPRPAGAFGGPEGQIYLPRHQTRPPGESAAEPRPQALLLPHCQSPRRRVQVIPMLPIPHDFRDDIVLDNSLLRADIARGEPVPIDEVLSLAAMAQAIYISSTLHSRELGRVQDCLELWREAAQLFDELCDSWANTDSNDPQIRWLLRRLSHFRGLSEERVELYTVSKQQRLRHAANRGDVDFDMSHHQRHNLEARGEHEPCSPPHIYQLGHF
jgi:hypothetical protein